MDGSATIRKTVAGYFPRYVRASCDIPWNSLHHSGLWKDVMPFNVKHGLPYPASDEVGNQKESNTEHQRTRVEKRLSSSVSSGPLVLCVLSDSPFGLSG
jgi:hypothetical protein